MRCKFAYSPADATATHCLLLQYNPDWFWYQLTWVIPDRVQTAVKQVCVVVYVSHVIKSSSEYEYDTLQYGRSSSAQSYIDVIDYTLRMSVKLRTKSHLKKMRL